MSRESERRRRRPAELVREAARAARVERERLGREAEARLMMDPEDAAAESAR